MIHRRHFLRHSSLVSLAPAIPTLFSATARAAESGADHPVLVVIQLDGGNDGLNTVVPYGDDGYGRARNRLRIKPDDLHRLDEHTGLHPSLRGLKELFDDGSLAIVQGVGYPNPDRSHFRSMKIWQTASFDDEDHDGYGWLGRGLDERAVKRRIKYPSAILDKSHHGADAVFVGKDEVPLALWGRRSEVMSLSRTSDLELQNPRQLFGLSAPAEVRTQHDLTQFVTQQVLAAHDASDQLRRARVAQDSSKSSYPNSELAAQLQTVSRLLHSGCASRVFYTVQSGYDTHANQLPTHARLLREFSDALQFFLTDLGKSELGDRGVVLVFSEFGRRVAENDSRGTDHGAAGPVFLAGRRINAALLGGSPDFDRLVDGDLPMETDFRRIYATLLDRWLGIDSTEVLGDSFETLPILS